MTENTHILSEALLHRAIRIHVIGCGGTGSQLIPRLAQLHKSMLALGHPFGIDLTVWDDDLVQDHNCLRQNFFLPDCGHPKSTIMVNRCNLAHQLSWHDEPRRFHREAIRHDNVDVIIGCVDSKSARREIDTFVRNSYSEMYWIDAGNDAASAQIVVGQYGKRIVDNPMRLPLVTELYPEIIDGPDDNQPSCSAVDSILKQGLATNAMAASWIYAWLAEAFQHGSIGWSGLFFNLKTGRAASIPVSREAWDAIRPAASASEPVLKAA